MKQAHGRRSGGFSLVEILVALAVSAILLIGLSRGVVQVIVTNAKSLAGVTAIKEVENAAHWLKRDGTMAQSINNTPITSTYNVSRRQFPLQISWTNNFTDNSTENVTYLRSADNRSLIRQYSVNGSPVGTATIVSHLGNNSTWELANGHFIFTINSTLQGFQNATEVRVIRVEPRFTSVLNQ